MSKTIELEKEKGRAQKQNPPIRSWDDTSARAEATWDFCEYLEAMPRERTKCTTDSNYAKKLFAQIGRFSLEEDPGRDTELMPIPTETKFDIFDFDPVTERDKLVTMVLPPRDKKIALLRQRGAVAEIYRCTWPPWLQ
jgi:hypothetical protein